MQAFNAQHHFICAMYLENRILYIQYEVVNLVDIRHTLRDRKKTSEDIAGNCDGLKREKTLKNEPGPIRIDATFLMMVKQQRAQGGCLGTKSR